MGIIIRRYLKIRAIEETDVEISSVPGFTQRSLRNLTVALQYRIVKRYENLRRYVYKAK